MITTAANSGNSVAVGDVDGDSDLDVLSGSIGKLAWYENLLPHAGDANWYGRFDSNDLVQVFQAGEYEDDIPDNSTWEEGDWNGDGDCDSNDLVLAFQTGLYEVKSPAAGSPLAAAVDWLFAQDQRATVDAPTWCDTRLRNRGRFTGGRYKTRSGPAIFLRRLSAGPWDAGREDRIMFRRRNSHWTTCSRRRIAHVSSFSNGWRTECACLPRRTGLWAWAVSTAMRRWRWRSTGRTCLHGVRSRRRSGCTTGPRGQV